MRPKITDVAKLAGVSTTTVSRVINNYGYLGEKTKQKVYHAMKELNYFPNSSARSLHGKQAKLIGLIFPSITNPFFAELVNKLENNLFIRGYKSILCNSADNHEKEIEYLGMLLSNQVDGIIAGAHNENIKEYSKYNLPIISFDRYLARNIPIVCSDNYAGSKLATEELHRNGAKNIYFLGGSNTGNNPTNLRAQAYTDTMLGLKLEPKYKSIDFFTSANVKYSLIEQLLKNNIIDGICCSDDLTAMLVIKCAKNLGINIPGDLKVIGYDGTAFIQKYYTELSTVAQPIDEIVNLLIELLILRINNLAEILAPKYVLPVQLISSQTTRKR